MEHNMNKIKIVNRMQLESVLYTLLNENENCCIELKDEDRNSSIYFVSYKLPNGLISISLSAGKYTSGDVIMTNDGKSRMEFVKDSCKVIDFDKLNNLSVYLHEEKKQELQMQLIDKKQYQNSYAKTVKTVPVLVKSIEDANFIFNKFLANEECNKLVIRFKVYMPEFKHNYEIELVIDKVFIFKHQYIFFNKDLKGNSKFIYIPHENKLLQSAQLTEIYSYNLKYEDSMIEACKAFEDIVLTSFRFCCMVSKEEVDLYAYCNCELI